MEDSHTERIPLVKPYRFEEIAFENDKYRFSVLNSKATFEVTDYYCRNREFHSEYSQTHDEKYFTNKTQKEFLFDEARDFNRGRILPLFISVKGNPRRIIGRISFFHFAYGGMQNCIIGYSLDKEEEGKGIMTESIPFVMKFLSEYYSIHRVEAYILPKNRRSINLIKRVGFKEEGIRHQFMHINGNWEDHLAFYFLFEKENNVKKFDS